MKKSFLQIAPLFVSVVCFSGCSYYSSKPGKLEQLVGTYELFKYEMKHDNSEKYDHKEEIGAKAFFSVDKNGYGYYGYADNDTQAVVHSTFSEFYYDDEKPELVKALKMKDGTSRAFDWQKKVGCFDEPTMGFNKNKKTLAYTIPYHELRIYKPTKVVQYQYVCYKKISNDTGYALINEKLGTNYVPEKLFEMKNFTGFYTYNCSSQDGVGTGIYEYMILDMDSYQNGAIKCYYSLKENPGKTVIDVPVEVVKNGVAFAVTIFDRTFDSEGSTEILSSLWSHYEYSETDKYYGENFTKYQGEAVTIDDVIADLTK